MAKKNKTEEPSAAQLHNEQMEQGLKQLKSGTKWIVTFGLLAAVGLVAYTRNRTNTAQENRQAVISYLTASSIEQKQAVVVNHPESPQAALAQIEMAVEQFQAYEYEGALSSYDTFLASYPEHDYVPYAQYGRLMALEAMGRLTEAQAGFESLADHPLVAAQAQLGIGRCLEQQEKFDEALAQYAKVKEGFADSVWAAQADEAIKEVERIKRQNG